MSLTRAIYRIDNNGTLNRLMEIITKNKIPIHTQELYNRFNMERQILGKKTIKRQTLHEYIKELENIGVIYLKTVVGRGNPKELSLTNKGKFVLKEIKKIKKIEVGA